jgi:hypothetical protein
MASKKYPELQLMLAIPNGGHRHKAVAAKMKAEGVKAGVPDIFLPVARGEFHGLFIELKKLKGGRATSAQCIWLEELNNQGYMAVICKGWLAAKNTLENYLNLKGENG